MVGWNLHCRDKYNNARAAFLDWLAHGKVRYGDKYESMKLSRKILLMPCIFVRKTKKKLKMIY